MTRLPTDQEVARYRADGAICLRSAFPPDWIERYYTEQYVLTAIFFWLMAWRVLDRYRLGTNAKALAMLAVASCLLAALLEAGFFWSRRGFGVMDTLGVNFALAVLAFGYPPAWQVLAFGIVVARAAAAGGALRAKAARLQAG